MIAMKIPLLLYDELSRRDKESKVVGRVHCRNGRLGEKKPKPGPVRVGEKLVRVLRKYATWNTLKFTRCIKSLFYGSIRGGGISSCVIAFCLVR